MAMDDVKVSIRIPGDLAKWADDQPGTRTEVFVRALTALKDGPPAATTPQVAELEAQVASLTEALAKSRKVAQALMPMADRKPERGSGKLVADTLPVAGDQFPEQETWWQKQQRTNAAKATKAGR